MDVYALLSGGMDSATLIWYLKSLGYKPHGVLFDYGQRHKKELGYARDIADLASIGYLQIDLSSYGLFLQGNSQTDRRVAVPEGHYAADTMKQTVVPNRNMVMLTIAAGIALSRGVETLAFGAHAGDHAIYPDCREEFVTSLEQTIQLATGATTFDVLAPFVRMTKTEIAQIGAKLGVPFERTWSCYKGNTLHCGKCGTCVERQESFRDAGLEDPTLYEMELEG